MNPLNEEIRKIFAEPVQLGGDKVTLPGIEVAVMAAIRKEKKRIIKQLRMKSRGIDAMYASNPGYALFDPCVLFDDAVAIVEGER